MLSDPAPPPQMYGCDRACMLQPSLKLLQCKTRHVLEDDIDIYDKQELQVHS